MSSKRPQTDRVPYLIGAPYAFDMLFQDRQTTRARSSNLGAHALDGFELMGEVQSPYGYLSDVLHSRVIGQDRPIAAVMEAMDRLPARHPNDDRPIATFAFLGPTGVGKTEMARAMAEGLGVTGSNLIKIDCSAYSHGHEVANLIGSPKGYTGYAEGAVFGKERVEKQGTVILFDEIEKGAAELHRILLQVMDDGLIQLSNGDMVNFRNTVLVMTSNLGARDMTTLLSRSTPGFGPSVANTDMGQMEQLALREFERNFSPEFLNRLTEKIVFKPHTPESLREVLRAKLEHANRAYEDMWGVRLSLSDKAVDYLIESVAEQTHMGARPLVRQLETEVYTQLGRQMSAGNVREGTEIRAFHCSENPIWYQNEAAPKLVLLSKANPEIKRVVLSKELVEYVPMEADATEEVVPAEPEE